MTPLTILVTIIAYFAVLFTTSYLSGRKADNAGFFSGNRKSSWWMVAFAMIGASISGVTYVSVPGMVAASGFGYLQMVLGFILGQLAIAYVLTPMMYRMNLVSIYQFLESRFGMTSYRSGAWLFFVSKMLGASVRLFLVCLTLQVLLFDPLGLPFLLNVALSVLMVWLYTFRGGVKSLIWTDSLKTLCLIVSVVLCIWFITKDLGQNLTGMIAQVWDSPMSRIFYFDDPNAKQFFFKQFLAGMFTMIATNGLDQDLMQRNLSCKNYKDAQKNMIVSILLQLVVITTFLMLGVLLYEYASVKGIEGSGDTLFPSVATSGHLPMIVGILFLIGLISSAYSAAGSALTALTTSFTIDILGIKDKDEQQVRRGRSRVHVIMAIVMAMTIFIFNLVNSTSVIDAVYTLASYTYGPILGLFTFGIFCKRKVRDNLVPVAVVLAPVICFFLDRNSEALFNGYQFSYELLILNALITILLMSLLILPEKKD